MKRYQRSRELTRVALFVALVCGGGSLAYAQGLSGPIMSEDDPCPKNNKELWHHDLDVTWPGTVCHGELEEVDYESDGSVVVPESGELHCPLETTYFNKTAVGRCPDDGLGTPIFPVTVKATVPDNNLMVAIQNDTGDRLGVRCTYFRRIKNRQTGATLFEDLETEVSNDYGYQTLFFNQLPQATWNDEHVTSTSVTCEFAEPAGRILGIWAGQGQ